jgi:hypothetical protein
MSFRDSHEYAAFHTVGYAPASNFDPPWGRISSRSYSREYNSDQDSQGSTVLLRQARQNACTTLVPRLTLGERIRHDVDRRERNASGGYRSVTA